MHFLYPEFIYLMLVPAMLLMYLIATNKDSVERVFDADVLERLRIHGDALGRMGHNALAFVAFFFMALALAQPVIDRAEERVATPGNDLAIALDLSRSMSAKDFYPDRLTFAKTKLLEILPEIPMGRVAVLGFTRAPFVVAPPTEDREALRFLLEHMNERSVGLQGTDIGAAIRGAARLLRKSDDRTLLLVTDGGDAQQVEEWIREARKARMRVVVWMVATERGAPVPLEGTAAKGPVISRANEALKRLAAATGGLYVQATLSQSDEASIVNFFRQISRKAKRHEKVITHRIQLFYYPLAVALLILPFALYSFGGRRKILGSAMVLLLGAGLPDARAGMFDFLKIREGYDAYEKGEYNASTDAFEKLAVTSGKPEVWFDLGNSYYRSGRYKMACDAYNRVVTDNLRIERAKLYNLANCYVKMGDLERAAKLYRRVLEYGEEPNARYNLLLIEKYLKNRPQKRKSGRQESKKGEKEKKGRKKRSASRGNEGKEPSSRRSEKQGRRKLSRREERKWMELLEKQPLKAKLYPMEPEKGGDDVHPW